MAAPDPDEQRAATRDMWERAAAGWGDRADQLRDWGMPVSVAMVDALALQPGENVLELAAGPGDTGFMAAELVAPGGSLLSSDGAEAMVDVARTRASQAGLSNVEFKLLDLEWIDLPTASVDAVLCRWGIMLTVDPEAAAREIRRVLRPGGRAAFAVWDKRENNPWATIPSRALLELGHVEPPDPNAPGPFALAGDGQLRELLESAGFQDVTVRPVEVPRRYDRVEEFIEDTMQMSPSFSGIAAELDDGQRAQVLERIREGAAQFADDRGRVVLPGVSLVALASA
jgi:SAM-dependent methyltransferase